MFTFSAFYKIPNGYCSSDSKIDDFLGSLLSSMSFYFLIIQLTLFSFVLVCGNTSYHYTDISAVGLNSRYTMLFLDGLTSDLS